MKITCVLERKPVFIALKYTIILLLTMLALRFHPGEEEFILEENVPLPVIENDDDVLVKVEYAGLCGTDIHIVQGEFGNCSIEPITLGHEFSGVVIDSGVNVMLKTGTHVAIDPNRYK